MSIVYATKQVLSERLNLNGVFVQLSISIAQHQKIYHLFVSKHLFIILLVVVYINLISSTRFTNQDDC